MAELLRAGKWGNPNKMMLVARGRESMLCACGIRRSVLRSKTAKDERLGGLLYPSTTISRPQ